jgi:hypothetical protein
MTCHPCNRAEMNPLAGLYQANCLNCRARAFAHGQAMFEAEQAGKKTERYKAALKTVFGEDQAAQDEGHKLASAWAKRIKTHKTEAKA